MRVALLDLFHHLDLHLRDALVVLLLLVVGRHLRRVVVQHLRTLEQRLVVVRVAEVLDPAPHVDVGRDD